MSRGIVAALCVAVAGLAFALGAWVGQQQALEAIDEQALLASVNPAVTALYAEHLAKKLRLCEVELDKAAK